MMMRALCNGFGVKALTLAVMLTLLTGCHWDMWDQPRYEPLESGEFFGKGESSSRTFVENTVAFGSASVELDTHYTQGRVDGELVTTLPARVVDMWVTEYNGDREAGMRAMLERGQARFMIYCYPCHGSQGRGDGMIVQRGFPQPPSYNDPRLLESPIGYFYDVPTNGFGRMYSYASRIPRDDRWAIAAYVRALQWSQNVTEDLLTPEEIALARAPKPGDEGYVDPDAHHGEHGDDTDAAHEEEH